MSVPNPFPEVTPETQGFQGMGGLGLSSPPTSLVLSLQLRVDVMAALWDPLLSYPPIF